jgi:transposase-like protein
MSHAESPMNDKVNQPRTFEVLTAEPVRCRRKLRDWSDDEKARIVAATLQPGLMSRRLSGLKAWIPRSFMGGVARHWHRELLRPLRWEQASRSSSHALKLSVAAQWMLSLRIAPLSDLTHRVTLKLVAEIRFAHDALLVSKLGKKVSTNLVAIQSPHFGASRDGPLRRGNRN